MKRYKPFSAIKCRKYVMPYTLERPCAPRPNVPESRCPGVYTRNHRPRSRLQGWERPLTMPVRTPRQCRRSPVNAPPPAAPPSPPSRAPLRPQRAETQGWGMRLWVPKKRGGTSRRRRVTRVEPLAGLFARASLRIAGCGPSRSLYRSRGPWRRPQAGVAVAHCSRGDSYPAARLNNRWTVMLRARRLCI